MTLFIIFLVILTACLFSYTRWRAAAIETAFPPQGRIIDVDGVKVHVLEAGPKDAPAVVLVHGASGNALDQMLGLGQVLAQTRRVIAFDRPGLGYSERPDRAGISTPTGQARLFASAMAAIGLEKALVVGHSWGGAMALAMALDFPGRVSGLVLLAPVSHPWPGGITWYYRLAGLPVVGRAFCSLFVMPVGENVVDGSAAGAFKPEPPPADYTRRIAAKLLLRPKSFRANGRDMCDLKASVAAQAERYGEIGMPTLIMTGDRDGSVSPDIHSRALARQIGGARLIMLAGAGHMPHWTARERIAAEIADMFPSV
ncbi:MAG: alpha/beta fold hydrolase [Rhodobiaceae bacterium]|nr:alpha/beta fold hydrolase [Rhodobiaceae bacterium]MCC0057214.1 alpha/beta fold hydrolase [Rhodobiaceae bacterium]